MKHLTEREIVELHYLELSPESLRIAKAHLNSCSDCQNRLDRLETTVQRLDEASLVPEPHEYQPETLAAMYQAGIDESGAEESMPRNLAARDLSSLVPANQECETSVRAVEDNHQVIPSTEGKWNYPEPGYQLNRFWISLSLLIVIMVAATGFLLGSYATNLQLSSLEKKMQVRFERDLANRVESIEKKWISLLTPESPMTPKKVAIEQYMRTVASQVKGTDSASAPLPTAVLEDIRRLAYTQDDLRSQLQTLAVNAETEFNKTNRELNELQRWAEYWTEIRYFDIVDQE